jgi:hypothetical protein
MPRLAAVGRAVTLARLFVRSAYTGVATRVSTWSMRMRSRLGLARRFSYLDEDAIIERLVDAAEPVARICVDIGAGDGLVQSNTHALFRSGWGGLAVEADGRRFAALGRLYARTPGLCLARTFVTPDTVVPLLRSHGVPAEFGLLDLDIDGYDHWVLRALLAEFHPTLMCVEINEKIPPPLRFTVNWSPDFEYRGDHFYGQSISQLHALAGQAGYDLVALEYNNAFLMPSERSSGRSLSAEEAYAQGYAKRGDRLEKFPWNADMEPLQRLTPEQAVEFVRQRFANRAGEYELTL